MVQNQISGKCIGVCILPGLSIQERITLVITQLSLKSFIPHTIHRVSFVLFKHGLFILVSNQRIWVDLVSYPAKYSFTSEVTKDMIYHLSRSERRKTNCKCSTRTFIWLKAGKIDCFHDAVRGCAISEVRSNWHIDPHFQRFTAAGDRQGVKHSQKRR
jgi:hypothetical protein